MNPADSSAELLAAAQAALSDDNGMESTDADVDTPPRLSGDAATAKDRKRSPLDTVMRAANRGSFDDESDEERDAGGAPKVAAFGHVGGLHTDTKSSIGRTLSSGKGSSVLSAFGAGGAVGVDPEGPKSPILAKKRLKGAIGKVHGAVVTKNKYIMKSDEEKAALQDAVDAARAERFAAGNASMGSVALHHLREKKKAEANTFRSRYAQFTKHFKKNVTNAAWFANTITFAIFVAGFNVGAQTYPLSKGAENTFAVLDEIVLALFTIEVVLKMFAEGLRPWLYFTDGWNVFDFLVVVASFLPFKGNQIAMLRLMRLLRLLKLVRALPKLRMLVISLLQSAGAVGYVMLMVLLLFYLWAVIGVLFLAENDPINFGTLHATFLALWRAATGDDWTDLMYIAIFGCDTSLYAGGADYGARPGLCVEPHPLGLLFPVFYFVAFQVIASMMLINMFIGAIMMSMQEAQDSDNSATSLHIKLWKCENLVPADFTLKQLAGREDKALGSSDPYVEFIVDKRDVTSRVRKNTLDPVYNQSFEIPGYDEFGGKVLLVRVWDWDRCGGDDPLGDARINLEAMEFNKPLRLKVHLSNAEHGVVHLTVRKDAKAEAPVEQIVDEMSPLMTLRNRIRQTRQRMEDIQQILVDKRKIDKLKEKAKAKPFHSMGSFRSMKSMPATLGRIKKGLSSTRLTSLSNIAVKMGNSAKSALSGSSRTHESPTPGSIASDAKENGATAGIGGGGGGGDGGGSGGGGAGSSNGGGKGSAPHRIEAFGSRAAIQQVPTPTSGRASALSDTGSKAGSTATATNVNVSLFTRVNSEASLNAMSFSRDASPRPSPRGKTTASVSPAEGGGPTPAPRGAGPRPRKAPGTRGGLSVVSDGDEPPSR